MLHFAVFYGHFVAVQDSDYLNRKEKTKSLVVPINYI